MGQPVAVIGIEPTGQPARNPKNPGLWTSETGGEAARTWAQKRRRHALPSPLTAPIEAYTLPEVAKGLRTSVEYLKVRIRRGELPACWVGVRFLIRKADLDAWLDRLAKAAPQARRTGVPPLAP